MLKSDSVRLVMHSPRESSIIDIPKGILTLAKQESNVRLGECEEYEVLMHQGSSNTQIDIRHKPSQQSVTSMQIDGLMLRIKTHANIIVSGLRQVGLHICKKKLHVPLCKITACTLPPVHDLATAMASIDLMQHSEICTLSDKSDKTIYMKEAYKELNAFNTKLVSEISSIYTTYPIRHSQGVCLNMCTAYSLASKRNSGILAHTLEHIQLSDEIIGSLKSVSTKAKPVCKLNFLSGGDVYKITSVNIFPIPWKIKSVMKSLGVVFKNPYNLKTIFYMNKFDMPVIVIDAYDSRNDKSTSRMLSNQSLAGAVTRLRYIQSVCSFHDLPKKDQYSMSLAWASHESELHPEMKNILFALACVRDTSIHSHCMWIQEQMGTEKPRAKLVTTGCPAHTQLALHVEDESCKCKQKV